MDFGCLLLGPPKIGPSAAHIQIRTLLSPPTLLDRACGLADRREGETPLGAQLRRSLDRTRKEKLGQPTPQSLSSGDSRWDDRWLGAGGGIRTSGRRRQPCRVDARSKRRYLAELWLEIGSDLVRSARISQMSFHFSQAPVQNQREEGCQVATYSSEEIGCDLYQRRRSGGGLRVEEKGKPSGWLSWHPHRSDWAPSNCCVEPDLDMEVVKTSNMPSQLVSWPRRKLDSHLR